MLVNYDGWSQKWNLYHRINKVMPFRTRAKGYSGQRKVAIRNHYEFKVEDLERVSLLPMPVISCVFSITKKYNN